MTIKKHLHIRRLDPFGPDIGNWITQQFKAAKTLFGSKTSIDLDIASNKLMPFKSGIVSINDCLMGGASTADQDALFQSVPEVPPSPDNVVIFVVVDFSGWKGAGCAWHPPGQLGCMVTKGNLGKHKDTLGHELGHVLGLLHNDLSTMLMFPSVEWSVIPPLLSPPEIDFLEGRTTVPPRSGGDDSLALSYEAFRFELTRLEPRYVGFRKHGERAIQLLNRIYLSTDDPEYRARAVFAMSQVVRQYQDYGGVLDRAALAEGPDNAVERRAAADAAGQLLPQEQARRILTRLLEDDEESVRFLAERNLREKHSTNRA